MSGLYIDIIIIIFLSFGFIIGFKRGFTRQLVSLIGIVGVLVLSYLFKRPIALFLSKSFPIIKMSEFNDINIVIYDSVAFVFIFFILSIVLRILIIITNIFEKLLKATVILSIPSKILGGLLGFLENYIVLFIIIILINLPIFNFQINSKLSSFIKDQTPIVNNKKSVNKIIDKYKDIKIDKKTSKIINNLYN